MPFIVANQTKYLDLLPKILEGGHTLGIHCYDHGSYDMLYRDEEHYFTDFLRAQKIVHDYTGQYAQVVRFPGGSRTASYLTGTLKGGYQELYGILHDMGVRPYDWNVQPESATKTVEGTIVDFTHPRDPAAHSIEFNRDTSSNNSITVNIYFMNSENCVCDSLLLDDSCIKICRMLPVELVLIRKIKVSHISYLLK